MRGKVNCSDKENGGFGITPAYAGKRFALNGLQNGQRDHPRVCGEKAFGDMSSAVDEGSPPRMRGKANIKF